MHAGVLVKFCFAVNWSIEHLAMSLIVLSQYSENYLTSEWIASSLLCDKSIILAYIIHLMGAISSEIHH